ncbi:hypothetical protein ACUNV4_28065 [Granulosicoccus sp. 3-233]|uniref:hypothetical protein n=1 Tax=Granulosicoccus sp. 3-233 TaxID=3417969 RepID=UPI003D329132
MSDSAEAFQMSEKYLKEMLEADDTANFELYTKRFERRYLEGFTRERFTNDIRHMHERNGMNTGCEFLCTLRSGSLDGVEVLRFAWKGIYEKRDALIDLGIYKKDGNWYVINSAVY